LTAEKNNKKQQKQTGTCRSITIDN